MARVLGWGEAAPFYVDLESPVPASGTPKPGPLQVHLRTTTCNTPVTWFGLALVVAVAFAFWVRSRRRGLA